MALLNALPDSVLDILKTGRRGLVLSASAAALLALGACGDTGTDTASDDAPAVQEDTVAEAETGGMEDDAAATDDEAGADAVSQEIPANTELNAFFARVYEEDLARSPMLQSYRGIKDDYDKWDDISEAAQDEELRLAQARLEELRGFDFDALNANDKLSYQIFEMVQQRQIANDRFRHHSYIMNQFRAWHTVVPSFLINIHRVSSQSDIEAYAARLEKVGTLFDQVVEQMRIREEKGIFAPDWSYPQMLEASRNVITGAPFDDSGADSTLYDDFKSKLAALELDEETAAALDERARTALVEVVQPAYLALIAELEKQQELAGENDGAWKLPDGEAFYQSRLEYFTTTGLSAEEIHQIGLDNVTRIHAAMQEIMAQVGFEGTLQEFFEFMRTDQQFYYASDEEGRERYLSEARDLINTMYDRLPEVFGILPEAELVVKRVEPFREKSAGKAFYQSPAADGSRPGTYYANLYDMSQMPTYQMEALAYHEGVPGHHMQRAIAQELTSLPEFRKYASFTAYTEGWGLYSEFLPKEMGFYEDPYSDFGRLAMELWRACRLVVDTGIHHMKWTREEAIEYLVKTTPNPRGDAVKAIERYIVYVGQATAYLIGKQKILELRESAEAELGDAFDIRSFHDEVLRDGPVPLSVLEGKIARWVQAQKAAQ